MKSPFAGMDPYIESSGLWEDFHDKLIAEIYRYLAPLAPARYAIRLGKRSYMVLVESDQERAFSFGPDVRIVRSDSPKQKIGSNGGVAVADATAIGESVSMRAFSPEEHHESYVDIYELEPGKRLVTSIEVLSPSNKRPGTKGWKLYQRKRQNILTGGEVNLVEIDLLRGGKRLPMLDPWPDSPYALLVARCNHYEVCRVWPAQMVKPLPIVPVPLARGDKDLKLDLQPLIAEIYDRSRYGQDIDYRKPSKPPLNDEDAAWLRKQLRSRKRVS